MGQDQSNNEHQQDQGRSFKNALLAYSLVPNYENAFVQFVLEHQAPEITDFLQIYGTWMASNGMRVSTAWHYHWQDSEQTIYLDAGLNPAPLNRQPEDKTYFGKQAHFTINPGSAKQSIVNKTELFDSALKELVEVVRSAYEVKSRSKAREEYLRILE